MPTAKAPPKKINMARAPKMTFLGMLLKPPDLGALGAGGGGPAGGGVRDGTPGWGALPMADWSISPAT